MCSGAFDSDAAALDRLRGARNVNRDKRVVAICCVSDVIADDDCVQGGGSWGRSIEVEPGFANNPDMVGPRAVVGKDLYGDRITVRQCIVIGHGELERDLALDVGGWKGRVGDWASKTTGGPLRWLHWNRSGSPLGSILAVPSRVTVSKAW